MNGFLIDFIKEQIEKHEPLRQELIIPCSAQAEFEKSFSHMADIIYVASCRITECCYIISMEHTGLIDSYRKHPANSVHAVSLAVRRFYQKHGLSVHAAEIYVLPTAYGFEIRIALNTYGRKKIQMLNLEQTMAFKR